MIPSYEALVCYFMRNKTIHEIITVLVYRSKQSAGLLSTFSSLQVQVQIRHLSL